MTDACALCAKPCSFFMKYADLQCFHAPCHVLTVSSRINKQRFEPSLSCISFKPVKDLSKTSISVIFSEADQRINRLRAEVPSPCAQGGHIITNLIVVGLL